MFCDNCGRQNPDSARFCTGCGRSMDGSAPAPMVFASEVSSRLRNAVDKNQLLAVNTIAFYLGLHSLFSLLSGVVAGYAALTGSFLSKLLGGFGGEQVVSTGVGGLFLSLLGAYGLASARGLFGRQSWAARPATIASIIFAIQEFAVIFFAGNISGPLLFLAVLRGGLWVAIAACLTLPSVKETLTED